VDLTAVAAEILRKERTPPPVMAVLLTTTGKVLVIAILKLLFKHFLGKHEY
jgi:hypothetical protein